MDAAGDLTRLVTLLRQQKLVAPVELEADWQDVGRAIDALLKRTISGKAVLHVHARRPRDHIVEHLRVTDEAALARQLARDGVAEAG